jgi:hypothetical protein
MGIQERDDERGSKVVVKTIMPLSQAAGVMTTGVKISLDSSAISETDLIELRQTLQAYPGSCRVVLCMEIPGQMEVVMNLGKYRINPSPEFFAALENGFGAVAETLLALN